MSGPLENPAATPRPANGVLRKLLATLEMIKFEHSVFAMPFALTGAMLAVHGWPPWRQVFWLITAMVGARSETTPRIHAPASARFPRAS